MKVFQGGSALFFQKYNDYKLHDNDCNIIDDENEILKDGELFRHVYVRNGKLCEYDIDAHKFIEYSNEQMSPFIQLLNDGIYDDMYIYKKFSKDELIKFIIDNHHKRTHNLNVTMVFSPYIQQYFGLTADDIKKIWDAGIMNNLPAGNRWLYYKIFAKYIIENNSLILSEKQLYHAYQIYKLVRKRYNKSYNSEEIEE